MVISIISVGVYNAYLLLIRQTKEGQVKQIAALSGKQVIEEIKADTGNTSFTVIEENEDLKLGDNIILTAGSNLSLNGEVFFDKEGKICTEESREYTATINFKKTTTKEGNNNVELNQASNLEAADSYKVYIGRKNSVDYITDNLEEDDPPELPSDSDSKIIYIYLEETSDDTKEKIIVNDYEGRKLFETTQDISKNLIINFSKYVDEDGLVPEDAEIEVNIYNKTQNVPNVYIQKYSELNAEVQVRKGELNLYDNRSENGAGIGVLYDITVNIINKDHDTLFTGYSKQNIVWKNN